MSFLIITGKIIASFFLLNFLVAGIMRANPRFHRYQAMAEYMAGFIITFSSCIGLYYLWW